MNEHAEIILFEKDDHVSFANCGLPYHIGKEIPERNQLLVASPELLRRRFRLDVRVAQEVLAIDRDAKEVQVRRRDSGEIYRQPYDKLILAPGASPLVPPIPGTAAANVMTLRNLEDTDRIKARVDQDSTRRAVVVGAGFIGLEMVEQLVHRGIQTSLVELRTQVLPLMDAEMAKPLEDELRRHDVELFLGRSLASIRTDDQGLASSVLLSDGTEIATDLVILGIGVKPNVALAVACGLELGSGGGITTNSSMQTSDPDIYAVGDAVEYRYRPTDTAMRIALAGPANRAGRLAGEHAATGHAAEMQPILGTSIVRVFGLTAAVTGLTEAFATRLKMTSHSVTIVANHHAGYYPGAKPLTLKLTYSPDDGRVLGSQVVGSEGVDKRIDVIATAMHFAATVRNLAGLDLAYAPPFGSAKDPVHIAAFVACNQLDGIESLCSPANSLNGRTVLDVRTEAEVKSHPLAGAETVIHIPVDELRERIDELDPAVPLVVTCGVGVRGHVAARILKQHGFNVQNLSGGATIRDRAWRASQSMT
jgi:NADPH-dependent 2,4-dienoyl-CoA reductase/sulfur reductase-like enzyme/rhodanese-related sulfurtransferase